MTAPAPTQPPARDAAARAGRWEVAADASTAAFSVRDKLVTTVHGTLPVVGGGVVIDHDGAVLSATVELAVDGIATGNRHRDADLRKPGFLDAAGHPRIRVEARATQATSSGWDVDAVLTARGRAAPVRLEVARVMDADDEVRVRVTGRLDRSPLGITAPRVVVGHFVDLDVDLTCRRAPAGA